MIGCAPDSPIRKLTQSQGWDFGFHAEKTPTRPPPPFLPRGTVVTQQEGTTQPARRDELCHPFLAHATELVGLEGGFVD